MQHDARGTDVFKSFLFAALFFHQLQNAADIFFVGQDGGENHRLFDFGDLTGRRPARRIIDFDHLAIGLVNLVAHAGRGRDQLQIELALQSLLDNFHVQQAEKAAAESESKRDRAFRLEEE